MEIKRWERWIFLKGLHIKINYQQVQFGLHIKKIPLVIHDTKKWYDVKQCAWGMSQGHCYWLDCDCFPKKTFQSLEPIPSSQRVVSLLRFSCLSFPSDFAISKTIKIPYFFQNLKIYLKLYFLLLLWLIWSLFLKIM